MARSLTAGQRAAVRAAIDRRGALGITQEELARRAGVSLRTIVSFEGYRSWPYARTIGQIERLGLHWPVGYLRELADDVDTQNDGDHRYSSRARAARIRELEAQRDLIEAELRNLGDESP